MRTALTAKLRISNFQKYWCKYARIQSFLALFCPFLGSRTYSSEASLQLIHPKKQIRPRVPVCLVHMCTCAIILVLVCGIMYHIQKDCLGFSVGYQRAPSTSEKKTEPLVPASASLPTAGSALPPVGRATPLLWVKPTQDQRR